MQPTRFVVAQNNAAKEKIASVAGTNAPEMLSASAVVLVGGELNLGPLPKTICSNARQRPLVNGPGSGTPKADD